MERFISLEAVDKRFREVKAREEDLRRELAALDSEANDLAAALRVLERFTSIPEEVADARPEAFAPVAEPAPETQAANESDLTFPEMFAILIKEANAQGRSGVTSAEIIDSVRKRWRADVTTDHIRPRLWRLVRLKRMKKLGSIYSLPQNAKASLFAEAM